MQNQKQTGSGELNPIQRFKEDGLYRLKYPAELRDSVEQALIAWKAFIALPETLTDTFPYGKGVGYEHKLGGGPTDDTKQDFHFTLDGADSLRTTIAGFGDSDLGRVSSALVQSAERLVGQLSPSVRSFAHNIEKEFGIPGFMNEVSASQGTWFVRFLHYPGNRITGENTAVPHIDKSAFTFHLHESDLGLQGLHYTDKQWFDTPVSDTETVIFPGYQLQHKSKGEITALCHRVVANERTAVEGRYSIVVFFLLKNTPQYDKNSRGRLQDQEPGFNYGMPFEEVRKQFK